MKTDITTINAYMETFPKDIQTLLQQVGEAIKSCAPTAVESIAYGMPAYKIYGKPLVYFGGFKNHIGFYATPSGHTEFADELSKYIQGKGSVQFPINQTIPYDLIKRIVAFRVKENELKYHK